MPSDNEVRARYGPDVRISRKGRFTLIHLDAPSDAVVAERTAGFDPALCFEADCPLCEIQRGLGIYLFDDYPDEDDYIVLD